MSKAERLAQPTQAVTDVLAERQRQITAEGWTPEHDDEHCNGEIARAAAAYALQAASTLSNSPPVSRELRRMANGAWPWGLLQKKVDERRDLVKAGALILAEIERLDRVEQATDLDAWDCPTCCGTGKVTEMHAVTHQLGTDMLPFDSACPACEGLGSCGPDAEKRAAISKAQGTQP